MLVPFSLNADREIIWSLPRTQILLTMKSPDAEVDTDRLDQQQKWVLSAAIRAGKINSNIDPSDIMGTPRLAPTPTPVKKPPANQEGAAGIAKQMLSGRVSTVKKEILNADNIRVLKLMLALESAGKKRKSILDVLDTRLRQVAEQVAKSIADESDPVVLPPKPRTPGRITYDDDVLELENKTVEIDLSTGEILSD